MNHNHTKENTCTHGCCDSHNTSCSVNGCCSEDDAIAVMDLTSYTCSMHPNVKQDKPGSCPECGMNLVPIK